MARSAPPPAPQPALLLPPPPPPLPAFLATPPPLALWPRTGSGGRLAGSLPLPAAPPRAAPLRHAVRRPARRPRHGGTEAPTAGLGWPGWGGAGGGRRRPKEGDAAWLPPPPPLTPSANPAAAAGEAAAAAASAASAASTAAAAAAAAAATAATAAEEAAAAALAAAAAAEQAGQAAVVAAAAAAEAEGVAADGATATDATTERWGRGRAASGNGDGGGVDGGKAKAGAPGGVAALALPPPVAAPPLAGAVSFSDLLSDVAGQLDPPPAGGMSSLPFVDALTGLADQLGGFAAAASPERLLREARSAAGRSMGAPPPVSAGAAVAPRAGGPPFEMTTALALAAYAFESYAEPPPGSLWLTRTGVAAADCPPAGDAGAEPPTEGTASAARVRVAYPSTSILAGRSRGMFRLAIDRVERSWSHALFEGALFFQVRYGPVVVDRPAYRRDFFLYAPSCGESAGGDDDASPPTVPTAYIDVYSSRSAVMERRPLGTVALPLGGVDPEADVTGGLQDGVQEELSPDGVRTRLIVPIRLRQPGAPPPAAASPALLDGGSNPAAVDPPAEADAVVPTVAVSVEQAISAGGTSDAPPPSLASDHSIGDVMDGEALSPLKPNAPRPPAPPLTDAAARALALLGGAPSSAAAMLADTAREAAAAVDALRRAERRTSVAAAAAAAAAGREADATLAAALSSGMALVVDVGYIPLRGGGAGEEVEAAVEAADAADAASAVDNGNGGSVGDGDGSADGALVEADESTWEDAEAAISATPMGEEWKALATEVMDAAESAHGRLCHTRLERAFFLESDDTDTEVWIWRDPGRRLAVVAFRGTETVSWKDLATDAMAWQVPWVPGGPIDLGGGGGGRRRRGCQHGTNG